LDVPVIRTEDLTLCYGRKTAVDRLGIAVEAREIFALLGPNGAGKTSTIKILTTLLPPTSGRAEVAGCDVVRDAAEVRHRIGYVPQLVSADGALTGYENLLIFAKLYGLGRAERQQRVKEALSFMGLKDAANQLVRQYSGGMIRRLEIAQSMMHRPQVLFLDEPTGGLDPVARKAVWERIARLRDEFGTTIFFTTHLMEEADATCTRLAMMHGGKAAAVGTPAELKAVVGPGATLDDVFIHYSGGSIESGGSYRETSRERRVARRLG
jgi:ABC-2 type transport system ATP-binding protein